MLVLVTGATGNVGRELVPQLVDAGLPVRAFVREPAKATVLGPGVELAPGNLDDPDALRAAMRGVRSLYLIAFSTPQIRNALKAARLAGVTHVVRQSTIEAGAVPPLGPGRWHREQEEAVEASGIPWTHLRPTMMMPNTVQWWARSIRESGTVYFPGGEGRVSPVDPGDIAAVGLAVLTQPGHAGCAYDVTGPELLTIGDMVAILSEGLGRPLRYVDVPEEATGPGMERAGLSPTLVAALVETLGAIRTNRFAYVADTVARLTGRAGSDFRSWCREHAGAFAG